MNIQATGVAGDTPRIQLPPERAADSRQRSQDAAARQGTVEEQKQVQPEELISQIKAITEDGLYSVQFESNDNSELIVKVIDRETDEVIRQIPPEELVSLSEHLQELRGNLVDTVG